LSSLPAETRPEGFAPGGCHAAREHGSTCQLSALPHGAAARPTVCMVGSLKPSDLIGASFVGTLRSRRQRNPVRFTSYASTTRMRRSRSNVLHSARENAYAAGEQHSLPSHTRKVAGSIRRRPQSFMPRHTAVLLSPFIHRQCLRTDRNHPRLIGLTSGQSIWRTRINEKVCALLGFGYP